MKNNLSRKYSDSELCALILKKKKAGFDYLYTEYCGKLYGIALDSVKSSVYAGEITQIAFSKIWSSIQNYNPEITSLNIWFLRILFCTIKDYLSKKNIPFSLNPEKFSSLSIFVNREKVS